MKLSTHRTFLTIGTVFALLTVSDIGQAKFDWPYAVNEGSQLNVGLRIRDLAGRGVIAHLINTKVSDEASGAVLVGPTDTAPTGKAVTVTLGSPALAIQDPTKSGEWRLLTVIALLPDGCTPGSSCVAITEEVRIWVNNLNLKVLPTPGALPTPVGP
jgi:hypothetical protein